MAIDVTGRPGDVRLSDVRLPPSRIVIPSAAEGSLSFAVKRTMFGKLNRETCFPGNFRASPNIYIRGEAATKTPNPEP